MTTGLKITDRVKIIFGTYDKYGAEGNFGTIVKKGVQNFDWIVRVEFPIKYDVYQDAPANAMGELPPPPTDDLGFNSDELELVEDEAESAINRSVKATQSNTLEKDIRLLLGLFGDSQIRSAIDARADRAEIWEVFNRVQMEMEINA